jgi:hypothetical protein
MRKPTEYKSLSYSEIKSRKGTEVSNEEKTQAFYSLDKFFEYFKNKYS